MSALGAYAEIANPELVCRYGHTLLTGSLDGVPDGKYVVTPQGVFQLPSRLDQPLETFTLEDGKLVSREIAGSKVETEVKLNSGCTHCPSFWVDIFKRFYVTADYLIKPDGSYEVIHLDDLEHVKEFAGPEASQMGASNEDFF